MPSYSLYKHLHSANTIGEAHKMNSDMLMESTWDTDIATRDMYFYDWYHDDYKTQLNNLDPIHDSKKIKMRCKFIVSSTQTYEKDNVTYRLQMRPSQEEVVTYYDEMFKERYGGNYPIGLYCDIPDNKGRFNRWLVVGEADYNDPQFSTFELLRCDYVINVIIDGKKYYFPSVLRSQSSYNSGIWTGDKITITEDQQKFCVPMNRDVERIYYNQRILIDNAIINREPRCWEVSKVNAIDYRGVEIVTLAQSMFDANKDYIELNEKGNVIGLWADYYSSAVKPTESEESTPVVNITSNVTYSGKAAEVKIGGSYKKFSVTFYQDNQEIELLDGEWSFNMYEDDGFIDCSNLLTITTPNSNEVKIKFIGDDSYIGRVINVSYTTTFGIFSSVDVAVVGL